jgi:FMN phosphatase YigB (HAD superfamily)
MKKLIVDIDNTLWDFAPVLYERMRKVNPALTPPSEWYEFDFWKRYISPRVFFSLIRDIHMNQNMFTPYRDAGPFLTSLKEIGFHIIIASHRVKETRDATVRWLQANNLVFDEIHISYDKTVLFDTCWGIIDDSPFTLRKAKEAGIVRAGLKMPWNEREDYPLFDNLAETLQYVKETLNHF